MWLCLLDYSKMVTLETYWMNLLLSMIEFRRALWSVSLWLIVFSFKIGLDVLVCRSKLPVYSQRKKLNHQKKKKTNNWIAGYSNAKKDVNLAALSEPNGNHQGWIEVGNNSRKFCLSAVSPTSETRPQLQHPRSTTSCRALM